MPKLPGFFLLLLAVPFAAAAAPVEPARVIAKFPHDSGAFTEGLFYWQGHFYESTGPYSADGAAAASTIRKVDLATGKVLRSVSIPLPYFGEGIVSWHGELISLTWRHQKGFRWSLDNFKQRGSFSYRGEGWGLTCNGKRLIMSDGTSVLRLLDPRSLKTVGTINVTSGGDPVDRLNELEYVNGEILANIWQTNLIARIDPATGHVVGWIDVSALDAMADASGTDPVPNGIAWDAVGKRLFVTGKNWPVLFQIALPRQ